mgnify:FL=1
MVACSLALNAAGESVATDMENGPKERGGGESNFDVDMIATAVTRLVTTGRELRFSCLPPHSRISVFAAARIQPRLFAGPGPAVRLACLP